MVFFGGVQAARENPLNFGVFSGAYEYSISYLQPTSSLKQREDRNFVFT